MAHDRDVLMSGDISTIWDALNTTLVNNGYKITNSVPHKQILAERGSRLVSGVVGGTKGGYRTTEVFLSPEGNSTRVKFTFKFSALGAGVAYKGAKQEIDDMVQMFQSAIPAQSPTQHQAPQTPSTTPQCPKCNKEVSPDFAVCPYCSASLKSANTCTNCKKELQPEFTVCPYCGTSR